MTREDMLIEPEELLQKLGNQNLRIYDAALNADQYVRGHIPGAAFFDHEKFSDPHEKYEYTMLSDVELAARIGEIGISHHTEVVFYAWGMLPYAARAWWILRYAGHNNVRVLNGGLAAWMNAGGRLERETRSYPLSVFDAHFSPEMFADRQAVLAGMSDADVAIINVLPSISYEASHITGSTCLPCFELMHDMDAFLPTNQLASRLHETSNYGRIITYCGGGIAAALNGMAHLMVGQENVAVYDGSMEEWVGEGLPRTGDGKWDIWKG